VLECYRASFDAIGAATEPLEKKAIEAAAGASFERAVLLGQATCAEAASASTIDNAIALLCKRGILQTVVVERREARKRFGRRARTRRPSRAYGPGPQAADLPSLNERVSRTLAGR
jgi:ADP-ribosylglycohydrolase